MLELADTWWQKKTRLEQLAKDTKRLGKQIANERAQSGPGRLANLHKRNREHAERDLEMAKSEMPKLKKELRDLEQQYRAAGYDDIEYTTWTPAEMHDGGRGIEQVGRAVQVAGMPTGVKPTGVEVDFALGAVSAAQIARSVVRKTVSSIAAKAPRLPNFSAGGKTTGVLRSNVGEVEIISGRTGPAASLQKPAPGFNAITSTHVEGHAAAIMRQKGIEEATIYINNPQICLPCRQNLAHMLPAGARLTVVLPDGTAMTFIGNAR